MQKQNNGENRENYRGLRGMETIIFTRLKRDQEKNELLWNKSLTILVQASCPQKNLVGGSNVLVIKKRRKNWRSHW